MQFVYQRMFTNRNSYREEKDTEDPPVITSTQLAEEPKASAQTAELYPARGLTQPESAESATIMAFYCIIWRTFGNEALRFVASMCASSFNAVFVDFVNRCKGADEQHSTVEADLESHLACCQIQPGSAGYNNTVLIKAQTPSLKIIIFISPSKPWTLDSIGDADFYGVEKNKNPPS
ncbi:unnamed protein product [Scomber scombrus]|uniref:Unnamed protein product n=1 Tax=Scomber scombrus TaxID=13677 RepID=A0AAV1NHF6_SCOSC